jgi:hypothetical protein
MVRLAPPLATRHLAALLAVLIAAAAGCGEKKDASGQSGEAAGSGGAQLLAADARAPDGVAFKKLDLPFGAIQVPEGEGWSVAEGAAAQVQHEDGTVIMLQAQDGISPDQRDDYLASYHDVQTRDAPRYERVAQETGDVAGAPGARVEGKFDNGTKFVTRDYLVFKGGKVVIVGGRTPAASSSALAALVDHMTASLTVK